MSGPEVTEELELDVAFHQACGEARALRTLLGRAGVRLIEDARADAVVTVLAGTAEVHYTSRRPLHYEGERTLREAASALARAHALGDASPRALILTRDADLDPLWDGVGDGPLYVVSQRALAADGAVQGAVALLARFDWILSPRLEARLDRRSAVLGLALAQALEIERLRAAAPAGAALRAGG